jgi:HSP20 family protein
MASLIKRHPANRELSQPPTAGGGIDPFRLMREMLRWDPFREIEATFAGERGLAPSFEVKETKEGYLFRADLPGVKEGDVQISLTGNRLTISGHREQEQKDEGDQYFASEITYGSFVRSFTLPDGTDPENVKADMKDGVLSVIIPKKPEVQPRKIEIGKGAAPAEKDKDKAKL